MAEVSPCGTFLKVSTLILSQNGEEVYKAINLKTSEHVFWHEIVLFSQEGNELLDNTMRFENINHPGIVTKWNVNTGRNILNRIKTFFVTTDGKIIIKT